MATLPLRYKVHASMGNLYIWRTDTDIGIAPTYEEWEEIKKQGDRLIEHAKCIGEIENANLPARDSKATPRKSRGN